MKKATQSMRSFAALLRAHEMLENSDTHRSFSVIDKLQAHLTIFMGRGGFRALISRALALAAAEVSWLKELSVKAEGNLDGGAKVIPLLDAKVVVEGEIVLIAHVFGLLAAFIGKILTLRLVHEIWPKLPLNNVDFGMKEKK